MTADQLIWLSCCVSVALLAVQACFVWQAVSEVKTLQHQRKTAEDLRELHAEIFVGREHTDSEESR